MQVDEFLARRRSVETAVGPIAYTEVGEGPAAVFVHGVLVNGLLWRNAMAQLADVRRCVAIDLPGHGGTPWTQDQSLHGLAGAVLALCDALGLDQVDLVGSDTGGAVCQLFAAANPDRVRTLTLTNCDVHDHVPPPAFEPALQLAAQGRLAPLLLQVLEDDALARSEVGFGTSYERPQELDAALIRAYLEPVVGTPERGQALECSLALLDRNALVDAEPSLRALTAPALLVWGDADVFFPVEDARRLAGILGNVRDLVIIPGGRLFLADDRASEFTPHVRRHWAAVDAAALPA